MDESIKNDPGINVTKIDTADLNSISFEPQSPDAGGETDVKEKKIESGKEETEKPEEKEGKSASEEKPAQGAKEGESAEPTEDGKTSLEKKSRYQKRIDDLVRDKSEAARRAEKAEAELAALKEGKGAKDAAAAGKPKAGDFEKYEDYIVALGEWSADQKIKEFESKSGEKKADEDLVVAETRFQGQIETAKAEHADFEALVLKNKDLPITETMVGVLMDSDRAGEVLYYLGQHPEEAARIAPLKPLSAARALAKIEAKLEGSKETPAPPPPKKKISEAPPPITPVEASGGIEKEPGQMTNEEYRRWRQKRSR